MKFVLATKNEHKLNEFRRILGVQIMSQADAGVDIDVVEDADSFEGNAKLKARAIYNVTKMPTISDDSGLEVIALNNAPGVFSARYGDVNSDIERYELLLKNMENISVENRQAQFVCSICLVLEDGKEYCFTGICEGTIAYKPKGIGGFGYDPIFMVGDKSFSELDGIEKDKISHRGKALRKLKDFLKEKGINYDYK